jgi:uncharacterized protein (TIGR03067 family)
VEKLKADAEGAKTEAAAAKAQLAKLKQAPIVVAEKPATPLDPAEKDLKQLQGVWHLVEGEYDGKKETPKEIGIDVKLVIEGKRFTTVAGTRLMEGTFTLDGTHEPHTWTWTFTSGEAKGKVTPQLYKLVDGELYTCQSSGKADKMPANFVAGLKSDQQITRWTKSHPGGPLRLALFEQTGSFFIYSDKKGEERVTNFPVPYALPPNVVVSGDWGSSVIVTEVTAQGFRWRTTPFVDRTNAAATWTARGIAAAKVPEDGKKK